jgi:type IV pilus assembly protein PilW
MRGSSNMKQSGYTLVELMVSLAISGILLTSIGATFIAQRKSYDLQEQITEMQQTARAALDMMSREIRMAGYDPTDLMQKSDPSYADFVGIPYNASQLEMVSDLNGDGETDGTVTDDDTNEDIVYAYYDSDDQIKRKTGAGYFQPFAENIQAFGFDYLDSNGSATTTTADIRQIRITVTARTSKRDPDYSLNGGYRTYTLISLVTPANLG